MRKNPYWGFHETVWIFKIFLLWWGGGEDLGWDEGGKTIIRIYCMRGKNTSFQEQKIPLDPRLYYNHTISPFLFLQPNNPINPSLLTFKLTNFFINCYYVHICVNIHTPKYELPSMYNATSIYVLKTDHLLLNNQMMCFSLVNTFSCSQHS